MDEFILSLIEQLSSDPEKAIAEIRTQSKDLDKIEKYIKEYKEQERTQRDTQVGQIQRDKSIGEGKLSKMVKIYINHAQNIVQTLATFTVGKAVTLVPSEDNNLSELIKQVWRVNRLDAKILKATTVKMSETQVAMNFYIKDSKENSILNKILIAIKLKSQAKEIKCKVLDNSSGRMTPYFDAYGDLSLFMWEYVTESQGKTTKHVQIWDTDIVHYLNDKEGKMQYDPESGKLPHGFDKIPIVYDSQFEPEWYSVRQPIDRHEVALSKLGDANDYSGHPILITEGKVTNMPLKEESGKHFNIPIKKTKSGEIVKGDVRFLESEMAPESNRLEIEKLEDVIAYGSGVPNLTLDRLKELGNVAEKTVKLMFLGTELKAEFKRNDSRTFIERCLNVLISGIIKTTNTNLATDSKALYYDIHFNSILPSDIEERVTYISSAVESGIMSKETAVGILDLVDDVKDELTRIDFDADIAAERESKKTNPQEEEEEEEEEDPV